MIPLRQHDDSELVEAARYAAPDDSLSLSHVAALFEDEVYLCLRHTPTPTHTKKGCSSPLLAVGAATVWQTPLHHFLNLPREPV